MFEDKELKNYGTVVGEFYSWDVYEGFLTAYESLMMSLYRLTLGQSVLSDELLMIEHSLTYCS